MTHNNCQHLLLKKLQTYLSYRDHSEYELKCKLLKHFEEPAILKAIALAKKNKWIADPLELAQKYANSLHQKNKGWLFIQLALQKKQLPSIPKQEHLEETKCKHWIKKKFNPTNPFPEKIINKIHCFLRYRGFEQSIITKVIREYHL